MFSILCSTFYVIKLFFTFFSAPTIQFIHILNMFSLTYGESPAVYYYYYYYKTKSCTNEKLIIKVVIVTIQEHDINEIHAPEYL